MTSSRVLEEVAVCRAENRLITVGSNASDSWGVLRRMTPNQPLHPILGSGASRRPSAG